jgi:uncharacterized protein (DUF885 family)
MSLVLLLAGAVAQAQSPRADDPPSRQLHDLFVERFAWQMREFPDQAMQRGDYTHADRIADMSLAAIERRHEESVRHLERLRRIPRAALNENDQLNYDLFEFELRSDVDAHRFRAFLQPIGGRSGPQQEIPQMHERVRFVSAQDYANYLTRLSQTPRWIDDTMELMRLGIREGRTQPQIVLKGLPEQFETLLSRGLSDLAEPFSRWPDSVPEAQRRELRQRFDGVVLPAVRLALEKLGRFVRDEYMPRCRTTIAVRDLPDGEAFYAHQLRVMTTTDMTAREVHELGLREVARIQDEMMAVIRRTDFLQHAPEATALDDAALFARFIAYLRSQPRFYYREGPELLRGYRDVCKRIDAELPRLFHTLPRLSYGVRAIPDFMAPTQTTAYYNRGSLENGQPGYFYANTYALDQRPKYEMVALALHEAVPGHHFQIAVAQELRDVPPFRQELWITAFGEGWALYAERLGIEMGLYKDPYDDFGRLLYEMWRACRLVVDTGMHALGWSREQAIRFMLDHTALSPLNIENEVDRYIAWPGQATAYKIGELKIRALRSGAEQALADRFDVRAFHDVVLGAGPLPLPILERRVETWVESLRDRTAGANQRRHDAPTSP